MTTAVIIVAGIILLAAVLAFPEAKLGSKIMTVLSEGVPMVAFLVVFITFMMTIICRYVLRFAIPWSYEVSILGYMYCMFFGSGIALKRDEHVVFSLLYDKLPPIGQLICKLVYNAVLVVLIAIIFVPCLNSLMASTMTTGILKMPYKAVFAPFLWMLFECAFRCLFYMKASWKEYKTLTSKDVREVAEA
ncbi:MAG: TRAP transporter small permease subunit [Clostridia bacterium]|nr:TRAP transporter small permease subunit [Clostridia bacterium]